MVKGDLSRFVNSLDLIFISELKLIHCVTHFQTTEMKAFREFLLKPDAVYLPARPSENLRLSVVEAFCLSGWICVLCVWLKEQISQCDVLFPSVLCGQEDSGILRFAL